MATEIPWLSLLNQQSLNTQSSHSFIQLLFVPSNSLNPELSFPISSITIRSPFHSINHHPIPKPSFLTCLKPSFLTCLFPLPSLHLAQSSLLKWICISSGVPSPSLSSGRCRPTLYLLSASYLLLICTVLPPRCDLGVSGDRPVLWRL